MSSILSTEKFGSIGEFSEALKAAINANQSAMIVVDDCLLVVAPVEAARETLVEMIARKFAESPSMLNDLECRLKADREPLDW